MATSPSTWHVHQAGPLVVHESGAGPEIVVLHSLAMSSQMWSVVRPLMEAPLRLLLVDLRGHGRSAWNRAPFSIEELADDVSVALKHLGVEPQRVLGLSMGGSVAIVLAARTPEVTDLVLADTTAWYGEDAATKWEERAKFAVARGRSAQLSFQLERWFSSGYIKAQPSVIARMSEIFIQSDSEAHAAACRALGEMDSRKLLGDIRAHSLVVVGSEDEATPPSMASELARGISDAELMVVEGARHMAIVERPDIWTQLIERFVA